MRDEPGGSDGDSACGLFNGDVMVTQTAARMGSCLWVGDDVEEYDGGLVIPAGAVLVIGVPGPGDLAVL